MSIKHVGFQATPNNSLKLAPAVCRPPNRNGVGRGAKQTSDCAVHEVENGLEWPPEYALVFW